MNEAGIVPRGGEGMPGTGWAEVWRLAPESSDGSRLDGGGRESQQQEHHGSAQEMAPSATWKRGSGPPAQCGALERTLSPALPSPGGPPALPSRG